MAAELIDTHCHLTFEQLYADADRVVREAAAAGVTRLITVACSRGDIEPALELRRRFPSIWIAAGIHPHEAVKAEPQDFERLAELWHQDGVVAAGEMGLDYHYDFSPRDVQQEVFRRQLDLVREAGKRGQAPRSNRPSTESDLSGSEPVPFCPPAEGLLPLIIHCREALPDTIRILREHGFQGRKVVFHCFSGTAAEAVELRSFGWWLSFTGVITFKNAAAIQEAFVQTPVEQVMFETDAPYLSPEPVRKMRPNEPKNLVHTVKFAAELRAMTFEDLATASTENAKQFFALT